MKNYLYLWLMLLFLVPVANAITNPYLMTHEKFVHLNQQEKQTLIIKTMEMMVELEGKYAKEMKVTGQNSERLKSYAKLLKQFRNFLLSEAVAAEDFTKLLKSNAGNACIYGGWVSKVYRDKTTGSVYCLHPAESGDKGIVKAYQTSSSCKSPDYITCNPMVFGYKKSTEKSLFCIDNRRTPDLKRNKAHNVSYECMNAALKEDADKKIQDSKDDRLKAMALEMTSNNQAAFNSVHKYIFQTCACGKADEMDKTYKSYIRPHRTCYGMMKTLKAIGDNSCTPMITLPEEQKAFIEKWNNFFDKKFDPLSVPTSKLPKSVLEDDYKTLLYDPILIAYCDGATIAGKKSCTIGVENVGGNDEKSLATITFEGLKETEVDFTWPKEAEVNSTKKTEATFVKESVEKPFKITVTEKAGTKSSFFCDSKIPAKTVAPPDRSCSITVAKNASESDTIHSSATIAFTGIDADKVTFSWPGGGVQVKENPLQAIFEKKAEAQNIELSVSVKADDKSTFKCPAVIPALEAPPIKESCSVGVNETDDLNKSLAIVEFTGVKDDEVTFSWPANGESISGKPKEAIYKKAEAALKVEFTATLKKDQTKKIVCPIEIPPLVKSNEPKSIYKIEAKAEAYKDQDTTIPVKAIIKNDKNEEVSLPAGHKISWTRSGAGVSKIKEVKKEKKDDGVVTDDEDAPEEVKPLTDGEFATGVSISAPRVEADYKVTAHLIDDKGADVAQDDEAIPLLKAKESPKPNNQNNSGGPPRQAPVFQLTPFNTSTQGVQ